MVLKWFVQNNEVVDGPLTTDEVTSHLQAGLLSPTHLIWGHGFEAWQTIEWWFKELPTLTANAPVEAVEVWHYASQGQSRGPVTRPELINELKHKENLGDVVVWTRGMTDWIPLFEFHDLLNEIGVNKRQFPRVDATGRVVIKNGMNTLTAQLASIGEGGCGVLLGQGLAPGHEVSIEVHSPAFQQPIHAKAECRYSMNGILGLRFIQISVEDKGSIIQYVRHRQSRFIIKAA